MTTDSETISPIGESATESAARRAVKSAEYRAQAKKLAPYRVIARAVILARADRGVTQEELAAAMGTTGSAISRIESGTRPVTLDTLSKLGAALGITFAIGSPKGAGKDCVVVPQAALEVVKKPRPSAAQTRIAQSPTVAAYAKSR